MCLFLEEEDFVKCRYKSVCGKGERRPLFEDSIFLWRVEERDLVK